MNEGFGNPSAGPPVGFGNPEDLRGMAPPQQVIVNPEHVSRVVRSMNESQLYEIIWTLKQLINHNADQAKNLLRSSPQLSFAVLQSLMALNLINIQDFEKCLVPPQGAAQPAILGQQGPPLPNNPGLLLGLNNAGQQLPLHNMPGIIGNPNLPILPPQIANLPPQAIQQLLQSAQNPQQTFELLQMLMNYQR